MLPLSRTLFFGVAVWISCLTACTPSRNADEFEVTGMLHKSDGQTIRLLKVYPDRMDPLDSVEVAADGSFSFVHKGEPGALFQLQITDKVGFPFVPEMDHITFEGPVDSLGKAQLTGNQPTVVIRELVRNRVQKFGVYTREKRKITLINQHTQPDQWKAQEALIDKALLDYRGYMHQFIDTVHNPTVAAFATLSLNMDANYHFVSRTWERLKEEAPDHYLVKFMGEELSRIGAGCIRWQAPNFGAETPNGDSLYLKDFEGSMTLLMFWASYCEFSRQENALLNQLYQEYKDKGFEIMSYSIDDSPSEWKAVVQRDSLAWRGNLLGNDGWNSLPFHWYVVPSIPTTYLIDAKGVIRSRNIRAEELQREMDTLLSRHGPQ